LSGPRWPFIRPVEGGFPRVRDCSRPCHLSINRCRFRVPQPQPGSIIYHSCSASFLARGTTSGYIPDQCVMSCRSTPARLCSPH